MDHALIAGLPSTSTASTLAFADGRFNREKISAYALRSGRLEKRNGAEIYVVSSGPPAKTISFAFLAPGRIVLANSPALVPVVVARPLQDLPPEHRERLLRVAGSALIALARVDGSQENFSLFGLRSRDLAKLLRNTRWLTLAARPDGDHLKVAVEAECVSADAARELTRTAEAFRLLARILLSDARARGALSPQAAALAEVILRNGEFIQNDQRVQLRFEITAAALATVPSPSGAERSSPARPR
ncbi:MAG: hypothetical protein HY234_07745 [Acidobacteria bacterium]|nr:hypothetical protein [Acidobacteriota bacterium]